MGPGTGFRIGLIHGIEIRLDVSVLIIFTLVVYSLGAGLFPQWHSDWGVAVTWITALAAGLLLFVSLLAHELAHSIVAQARGIAVPRITLFVFGGLSEMEREPDTPAAEFAIAIVGPLTSFVLGMLFLVLATTLGGPEFADSFDSDPQAALAALGPLASLLMWLGPVNLMLGIFNLIPGFPLDGGRVFRAALWWWNGDLRRATQWAAAVGSGFAWLLMGVGVFQALSGFLVQGLWLVLIGWFLNNAARGSQMQLQLRQVSELLTAKDLMRTHFETVPVDLPLQQFIDDCLLRSAQSAWPVLDGGRPVGLIDFDNVRASAPEDRGALSVGDVMGAIRESVSKELSMREALKILVSSDRDPIPVIERGHVVGLLYRTDIMRWLALHQLSAGQPRQSNH